MQKLKHTLLTNQLVKEETKREIKKYTETNENANTTYQNLQNMAKAVLRGKFIVISTHIKKKERSQINKLTLYLKELEQQEQTKPKVKKEEDSKDQSKNK